MKAPNTNFQTPEKFQASNFNETTQAFEVWSLRHGASLDLGAWNLEIDVIWSTWA
jgi:hypothetical protein